MINVLIVDDEKPARNLLKHMLTNIKDIKILGECENGFEAVKAINELNPDLVFLDIQMPKLTGFEVFELLEKMPSIIFITAYDQYAIKAFEINATDYLLKPFEEQRLIDAINKFRKNELVKETVIVNLAQDIANKQLSQIAVTEAGKIVIIKVSDIELIEANDDYVLISTNAAQFLKKNTMSFYETHLSDSFLRVHRSIIVNIEKIVSVELYAKQQYVIKMKNNKSVKSSISGYKKLKTFFNK